MPTHNFTTRWVARVKIPATAQIDYFDENTTGFGLRVSRSGRKSWFCMYRHGGRLRRYTFGTYPNLKLADARNRAAVALRAAAKGKDPAAIKKAGRLAETFKELSTEYLEKYAKVNKRSWKEDERIIRRELTPTWGRRKAKDITRRDVISILDRIAHRGAPIQANRVLALVRKIFNWAISRDIVAVNPCAQVRGPGKEQQRQRVLSDDEIRAVWAAFDQFDSTIGDMFRLRLLTAQRGGEVASMRWEDIDFANGWWTIPEHVAKNGLAHRVPLSTTALQILKNAKQSAKDDIWVFPSPTRKGRHIANVHKAMERARSISNTNFVLHDLRRTAASHMTGMGIPREIVGKILNHVESGVTRVYDRHSYDNEKRLALEKWDEKVERIVSGSSPRIISLPLKG